MHNRIEYADGTVLELRIFGQMGVVSENGVRGISRSIPDSQRAFEEAKRSVETRLKPTMQARHTHANPLYVCIEDPRSLVFSLPIIAENNNLPTEESDKQAEEYRSLIQTAVENFDPLVKALESALDRLERVDKIALKALNQNPSPEPYELGEVTRGRALLAEVNKLLRGAES